jgi:predicted amino acid racemase
LTAPRLEIDLAKIRHNARVLVDLLSNLGISVSGVTKAALGFPDIAKELLAAGVSGLADSRIENIQSMRRAAVKAHMTLLRSPMTSQASLVVRYADTSLNTELDVISELSKAAQAMGRTHGILLMVELGDLREGIMPRRTWVNYRHWRMRLTRPSVPFSRSFPEGIRATLIGCLEVPT